MNHKSWRIRRLEESRLYAVTDFHNWTERELKRIEDACRGGADIIQLRSKTLDKSLLETAARQMRKITSRWNVLLIINDHADMARDVEADGVHLGQDDMAIKEARTALQNKDLLIGKSTHNFEQALRAEAEGANYIAIGPIFSTPTKPEYPAVGLELIQAVSSKVQIPQVAIGGINTELLPAVLQAGAKRIAVVRAIFGEENVLDATQRIKEMVISFNRIGSVSSQKTFGKNLIP